jgi:DUF1365 family protein
VAHAFTYRLYMMYLDLAELPRVFDKRWLWSASRPALARFRRRDHLGDPAVPLDRAVRDLVEEQCGERPEGPIRLLTQLRHCGYVFNPVSFYYCFDQNDNRVEAIVAEVNNTPWGERHCYVLPQSRSRAGGGRHRHGPEKVLHVSPFMPMDIEYDWRFNEPGERLTVHMENARAGKKLFDATLVLERRPITSAALAGVLLRFPLMTGKIIAAIHWQALRLWLKRTPVYDHPAKRAQTAGRTR